VKSPARRPSPFTIWRPRSAAVGVVDHHHRSSSFIITTVIIIIIIIIIMEGWLEG
jgi:hypothetical protein